MSQPRRVAVIDIGSNSIHMIVAASRAGGGFEIVDRERDMVRLGAGTFRDGRIPDATFGAGVDLTAQLVTLGKLREADPILAFATSACREASNGLAFLDAIGARTGVEPFLLSGEEEARLIYLAVREAVDLSAGTSLILDIGGGSVEGILSDAGGIRHAVTMRLGVQRMRDLCGHEPNSQRLREAVSARVGKESSDLVRIAREAGPLRVIGTSGTLLTLCNAVYKGRGIDLEGTYDGRFVSLAELRDLATRLVASKAADRAEIPGIDERRLDTIHLGALVIVSLLDRIGAGGLIFSNASVREGMLLDRVFPPALPLGDVRSASVRAFVRKVPGLEAHADRVARWALTIFDATRNLHRLGDAEREICGHAARLHDIGQLVSHERHEHHAYHLLRDGVVRGFSDDEVTLLALVARYHRKGFPKKRHAEFSALGTRNRRIVQVLAGIVRVADGLDRGHGGRVLRVTCAVDVGGVHVRAAGGRDISLELWSSRRKAALLERALDRSLTIDVDDARPDRSGEEAR